MKEVASQIKLNKIKHNQKKFFYTMHNEFSNIYYKLTEYDISKFITPLWENYNKKLEKILLPNPTFSFLKDPIIRGTMFVTADGEWFDKEINLLERKVPKNKLKALLQEDYVGEPLILNHAYQTSHNSIHHLYHIIRYLDKTHCDLEQVNTIVEWGGGYGNMAKIFKRMKPLLSTYIIIDTPLFSCIQWLYLSTILGKENVHLLKNINDNIQAGKINLVSLGLMGHCSINGDLFVSTWGISESSRYAQDYVVTHKWFNSKGLLLAYQGNSEELPYTARLGTLAAELGASIEEIEFLPGNYYAFL